MLKIRLQRVGRKHEPTFRVVLTDSKNSTKSGRFHEILGSYDPRKKTEVFAGDRIKEWMGKGAQLSGTVHNLLVSHKIIEGKKINVLPKKSPVVDEEKIAAEKAALEAAEAAKIAEEKAKADALEAETTAATAPEPTLEAETPAPAPAPASAPEPEPIPVEEVSNPVEETSAPETPQEEKA
jgi:small subunit ribosomal protein S16